MKLRVEQLAHQLETTLGADALTADASGVAAAHLIDGKQPKLVCRPQSVEQIAAALRLCSEAEAAVIPRGGGTAMAIGNLPRRADVVIETGKLNHVIEHDHANLTATVQSGITLNAVQTSLAPEKQFVPLDAPFPERATIGGIVTTNLNGPRRSYYGSVRDLVIGMRVVLASGEQIKAGGKVVKNVAGYDMCKLFVGSLGTLGIVTEVTLRMAPIAERTATLITSGTLTQAERFTDELSRSQLLPAAVFLSNDGETEHWRLAVWCE
jgi:glycolate dehydrogenase FAD-binding subunit